MMSRQIVYDGSPPPLEAIDGERQSRRHLHQRHTVVGDRLLEAGERLR
jgi:hypothetical protein